MTTAATPPLDIEHLRSWIGREEVAEDLLTVETLRRFRATFDLPETAVNIGDPAPPLIHFCLAQPLANTARLAADGHLPKGGFLPPVPLPRRMWAGSRLAFHEPLRAGDALRRVSRIADVTVKEGRSGTLCFVAVEHRIEVEGDTRLEDRHDIVYRAAVSTGAPPAPAPAADGEYRKTVQVDAPLLFRYSALTFNGHRIHYDLRYVTEVEGYPGLVVHGPLQATLLIGYAGEIHGRPPDRFDFRGLSPLTGEGPVDLHARSTADGLELWTARAGGPMCMRAEARWR